MSLLVSSMSLCSGDNEWGFDGGLMLPIANPVSPFIRRIANMDHFHMFQLVTCSRSYSGRSTSSNVRSSPASAEKVEPAIAFFGVVSISGLDSNRSEVHNLRNIRLEIAWVN